MSFLDLYPETVAQAREPQARETGALPAGFDETFSAAWNQMRLFSQSAASAAARSDAVSDWIDIAERESGKPFEPPPGPPRPHEELIQDYYAKLKKDQPDLDIPEPTEEWINGVARSKSQAAQRTYADVMSRDHSGWGSFLGTTVGGLSDPVNLVALPFAPAEGAGVLASGLRWGLTGAAAQTVIEGLGAAYREQVHPGYIASGEPLLNIGETALGAAVIGGGAKGLSNVWSRVKTGAWPQSIRDAGNIIESQVNTARTNVLPGLEGEVAHQDVLRKAIDDIVGGRKVTVPPAVDTPAPQIASDTTNIDIIRESEALWKEHARLGSAANEALDRGDEADAHAIFDQQDAVKARALDADRRALIPPEPRSDPDVVEQNLRERWEERGQHPAEILHDAQRDAVLREEIAPPSIEAFHASPYDFDRFSLEHIGEGQGAQSYGHGLYFSEGLRAHEEYLKEFSAKVGALDKTGARDLARSFVKEFEWSPEARDLAISHVEGLIQPYVDAGESLEEHIDMPRPLRQYVRALEVLKSSDPLRDTATSYKVRINADRGHFLDWDKPLSEQSEHVRNVLQPFVDEAHRGPLKATMEGDPTIGKVLAAAHFERGKGAAEKALADAGIPGIKYLDQGSRFDPAAAAARVEEIKRAIREHEEGIARGEDVEARQAQLPEWRADLRRAEAEVARGQTHNFVVFDDSLIEITHKNGKPVAGLFGSHDARLDMLMDERNAANAAAEAAKATRAGGELPFQSTAAEARAMGALADGVASIARMVGHEMPAEQAVAIAERVAGAKTDDEARQILQTVADRPVTLADTLPSAADMARARREEAAATPEPPTQSIEQMRETLADPNHAEVLRADLDRARAMGDIKLPAGADANGEPIFRSLDTALENDVDAYKMLADELTACSLPVVEAAE